MVGLRDPRLDLIESDVVRIAGRKKDGYLPRFILEQIIEDNGLNPNDRNQVVVLLNGPNRLAKRRKFLEHNGNKKPSLSAWHLIDLDDARNIRELKRRERYAKPSDRNLREWRVDVRTGNSNEPDFIIQMRREIKEDWAELAKRQEQMFDKYAEKIKKEYVRADAARRRYEHKQEQSSNFNKQEKERFQAQLRPNSNWKI